jgi:putative spermidine/putrescine transport system substrate-binding protein
MSTFKFAGVMAMGALVAGIGIGVAPTAAAQDFKGEKIVVQTLTGTAARFFRDIGPAFEKKHNAKLELFEMLSADTVAKMRVNAGNQESDVWMVAESWARVLEAEKLLEPLSLTGVSNIPKLVPAGRRTGDTYVNMSISGIGLAYNTNKLTAADMPKTWADLANPKYKGCLLLPAANSTATIMMIAKLSYVLGGNNDNIEPGMDALKKIAPNVMTYWTGFDQMYNLLNSGQACLAVGFTDRTIDQVQKGAPLGAAFTEQGTMFIGNAVGVSKGTKKRALAEAYVNYLLSDEVQKQTADRIGQAPTVKGIDMDDKLKKLLPDEAAMQKSPTPDWAEIVARQAKWVERYTKEVVSR